MRRLLAEGYSVCCLVRAPQRARQLPPQVTLLVGDITDAEVLARGMAGRDVVFYLANAYAMCRPTC